MPRVERILEIALLAAPIGCGGDLTAPYETECDDDAIGWTVDIDGVLPVPPAEYEVVCETGWGHGVETREAASTVALQYGPGQIIPHPDGGFLLVPDYFQTQGWSDLLGVELTRDSLLRVDERFETVLWSRSDRHYRRTAIVGAELWVIAADDDGNTTLVRIDAATGELLEEAPWSLGTPIFLEPAWPDDGGAWLDRGEGYDSDSERLGLYRMSSFGDVSLVRERDFGFTDEGGLIVTGLHPTPGGGVLWGYGGELESVADDGSLRWSLTEQHCSVAVDDRGGFLLGCTTDDDPDDQRGGLAIERRAQADGSLLWSRVHQRFDFANTPPEDAFMFSYAFDLTPRPGGGYVIAGGHAYPSTSCPQQPLIMAISEDGEVEWAHRDETCGTAFLLPPKANDSVFVLGRSVDGGFLMNGNIVAEWVQRFDL